MVSLGPDHLTLSGAVLDQLAAAKSDATVDTAPKPHHADVPLESAPAGANTSDSTGTNIPCLGGWYAASDPGAARRYAVPDVKSVDYLADDAAALKKAIAADAETSRKLADALKIFGEMEEQTRSLFRVALQKSD